MSQQGHALRHELIWTPILVFGFLIARFVPMGALPTLPCGWKTILGFPCLSCGGTRSAWALVRLDLGRALEMNPLVALAGLLSALYVIHAAGVFLGLRRPWTLNKAHLKGVSGACIKVAVISAIVLNWGYLIYVGR